MSDKIKANGLLGWFATNHVAANLLMLFIVVAGFLSLMRTKQEVFPEFSVDTITVTVPYRGASPEDVENGVVLRVEEAVAGIDGVKRLTSVASEGVGTTTIEVEEYADTKEVLDDVKAEIDRIITFPVETEKPVITELTTRNKVITIVAYGDVSERSLKELADDIRDDLTALDNISQVDVAGVRPYEISIEVSEENLRRYGLSFDQVAAAVGGSSLDIPAGSVKTSGGEILVRTKGQRYLGKEFEDIVVLTRNDGTEIRLRDIGSVKDRFEDVDLYSIFDGKPAALIKVLRVGEQGALDVANTVKKYVDNKRRFLPAGISLALWEDDSKILRSRMDLLKRNGYVGLILVFLCLAVFLDLRLAFWATLGIPISFLGAFSIMPFFDVSINMISLFALIMALGIVVDDAVVVGENIYAHREAGLSRKDAAITGVKEMAMPVILAVLTTMFAFIPLAYTGGVMGKFLRVLPIVVVAVLATSLTEALLILPAHLSGKERFKGNWLTRRLDVVREGADRGLDRFVNGRFARFVNFAVKWRFVTLAAAVLIFMSAIGLVLGGFIKFTFFDPVEADNMLALVTMPQGTPVSQTQAVIDKIEKAAVKVRDEIDSGRPDEPSIVSHISTTLGSQPATARGGPGRTDAAIGSNSNLGEVNVELLSSEERGNISSKELKNRWRDLVGEIPGVSSLKFVSEIASTGEAVNVELSHENFDILIPAADELKLILREYAGVSDISDSFEPGKTELRLKLKDTGRMLGLTLSDLARQVRQGFYGEEVQRIQRGRNDVRVMVRYPKEERVSLGDVENMRIRLPDGTEIPFTTVAAVDYGRGYANIRRVDRRRVVNVTADVDETVANAGEINQDLADTVLPGLMAKFPGLKYRFAGQKQERTESLGSLKGNFAIALLAIYALLAIQFRSYSQPLIVMSAIPFGIVGAVGGHLMMGFNLSILSLFGIVALSGVVVNDSLIMIDLINRERTEHIPLNRIITDCATRRFRPIMLTTLTTFFGLVPMLLERSIQARFLIPMAISLAFGVMFATCITLVLVPTLYMTLEELKRRLGLEGDNEPLRAET